MEHVILLHGIGAGAKTLLPLEIKLKRAEYITHNWSYTVRGKSLTESIDILWEKVNMLFGPKHTVHFIGHSLGGVLARGILCKGIRAKLGKLITLGSPHRGAAAGNALFGAGKKAFSFAFGCRIVDDLMWESSVSDIPTPPVCTGTISGTKRFTWTNPISWVVSRILDKSHDGFICVESTLLEGAESLLLEVDHMFMVFDREVTNQAIHFLRYGTFNR